MDEWEERQVDADLSICLFFFFFFYISLAAFMSLFICMFMKVH